MDLSAEPPDWAEESGAGEVSLRATALISGVFDACHPLPAKESEVHSVFWRERFGN